jgi:SAM-dependent methyltransferase
VRSGSAAGYLGGVDSQGRFEEMYQEAGDDLAAIPWAKLEPRPALVEWLEGEEPGAGRAALVVGCGYGDDAEELARRGWAVSAFDFSPTAIARARERFPGSPVDYRVADLFDLPDEWRGRFDLVVEIHTLQAIPIDVRASGPATLAGLVAPGGRLWFSILGRDEHLPGGRRPWPLTPGELAGFEAAGLHPGSRREEPLPPGSYTTDRVYEVIGLFRR